MSNRQRPRLAGTAPPRLARFGSNALSFLFVFCLAVPALRRSTVLLTNGELDSECFDTFKDIVVPPLTSSHLWTRDQLTVR